MAEFQIGSANLHHVWLIHTTERKETLAFRVRIITFRGTADRGAQHHGLKRLGRYFTALLGHRRHMLASQLKVLPVLPANEQATVSQQGRHQFNDLYEKLLKDLQSAGNAGEYYTPRALTQFIVEMVNPRLGEVVLDPACGTGGFLANAIGEQTGTIATRSAEDCPACKRLKLQLESQCFDKSVLDTPRLALPGLNHYSHDAACGQGRPKC